jgi:hypothetical protein
MCLRMVPENVEFRIAVGAVKTRSKALFEYTLGHGKSPCFLQVAFLSLLDPDYPVLILPYVYGPETLECAF